jgi:hypothetical protein
VTGMETRRLSGGAVRESDSIAMWSAVTTLAGGHPLRRNKCMFCGMLIGGRECRFVVLVCAVDPHCPCGQVPTVTQLVCADHGEPTSRQVAYAAIRMAETAHPSGLPACTG